MRASRSLKFSLVCRAAGTFLVSLLGLTCAVVGQSDPAFSYLELRLEPAKNLSTNDGFYRYWRPGFGLEGSVATPFYLGYAEAGLAWHNYFADDPQVPRMQAFHLFAGWGLPVKTGPLTWRAGFRLGNYNMNFDVETDFASERQESEFAMSVLGRVDIALFDRVSLTGGASRVTVFTRNRLYFNYIYAGISVRIPTGETFQKMLR